MPPRKRSPDTAKLVFNQASDLMDLFVILYRGKYKRDPSFNVIQTKYDMAELIGVMGFYQLQGLIEFYFEIDIDRPGMRNFLYSYEEVKELKDEREKDIENRKRLMAETKARVEKWKLEHGG